MRRQHSEVGRYPVHRWQKCTVKWLFEADAYLGSCSYEHNMKFQVAPPPFQKKKVFSSIKAYHTMARESSERKYA